MTNVEKLNKVLGKVFRIKNMEEIEDSMNPDDIDGWDSLSHFELVAGLEEKFDISMAVEDVSRMYSIGDIKKILRKYGVEI